MQALRLQLAAQRQQAMEASASADGPEDPEAEPSPLAFGVEA